MNCTSMRKESRVDSLECLFCDQSCWTLGFETSINSFHLTHGKPKRYRCIMSGVQKVDWLMLSILTEYKYRIHFALQISVIDSLTTHPVASHNRSRFSGRYRCGNSKSSSRFGSKNIRSFFSTCFWLLQPR